MNYNQFFSCLFLLAAMATQSAASGCKDNYLTVSRRCATRAKYFAIDCKRAEAIAVANPSLENIIKAQEAFKKVIKWEMIAAKKFADATGGAKKNNRAHGLLLMDASAIAGKRKRGNA